MSDLQSGDNVASVPRETSFARRRIPACDDPYHCITCSDEGVPMRVVSRDPDGSIATCESETGARVEVLTALIENVCQGDTLLVHAGTALARLDA